MNIILANFGKYAISDCPFISFLFVQLDMHELYFIYSVFISTQEVKFGRIGWKYDLIINVWKIKIQHDEIQARWQNIVM